MSSSKQPLSKEMVNCIILGNIKAEADVQSCLDNLSEQEKMVIESVLKRNKVLQNQISNELELSPKMPEKKKEDLTLKIRSGKLEKDRLLFLLVMLLLLEVRCITNVYYRYFEFYFHVIT
jgi:hypothetical protein